ncbi:zinc finger protein 2 homolog [Limulus polyphemus]|uniref:Zinc finger protein 2 homolog n=1 Tax=Limulus polyphemus TaxID=6850 RepID=A0ABM1T7T4_LIMPO|nr:zinc finger protein 2 homolog [Limulus polyphemus]XP_022251941.1 zinc finger protein 2 homolog [Limulus polyphemus]XP_022251942.1 zinc finger protein 2 homolog [Limulus polyphemus]
MEILKIKVEPVSAEEQNALLGIKLLKEEERTIKTPNGEIEGFLHPIFQLRKVKKEKGVDNEVTQKNESTAVMVKTEQPFWFSEDGIISMFSESCENVSNFLKHEDLKTEKTEPTEELMQVDPALDTPSDLETLTKVDCDKFSSQRKEIMHDYPDGREKQNSRSCRILKKSRTVNESLKHNFSVKTFSTNCDLEKYQSIHNEEEKYESNTCHKTLRKKSGLHKPIICDLCGKKFNLASNFKRHQIIHSGEKPYICDICNKRFALIKYLKEHLKVHTGEKTYNCDVCDKNFSQAFQLKSHQHRHHRDKQLGKEVVLTTKQWEKPGEDISLPGCLKETKRIPSGKKYICNTCGKEFKKNCHLKTHEAIHSGARPFICDDCGKNFTTKGDLKKHQRIHSGEKPYNCDVCGKEFSISSNFKRHQKIHTEKKPYNCDICGKLFAISNYLKEHQRVHTGKKLHSCDVCGKEFLLASNLRQHQKIHSGEKPYICNVCGKHFIFSSNLKKHHWNHTGEKPYCCDVCGKEYTQKSYLKRHQSVHSGDRPYRCDNCGKKFRVKYALSRHLNIHTENKPHICCICNKQFTSSWHCKRHWKTHNDKNCTVEMSK